MFLTTDYVTMAINGYRVNSLAHSALPDAPVIPDRERDPLLDRIRRRVRSASRLLVDGPSASSQGESAPAQG